jgi:hypothetical protein
MAITAGSRALRQGSHGSASGPNKQTGEIMETVFGTLAFTVIVVAQFAAVIAVSAYNRNAAAWQTGTPTSQSGFAARFAKHFDAETAKLYSDVTRRSGGRPPRGFLWPFFVAIARALRPTAGQPAGTVVALPPKATPAPAGKTENLPLAA